MCVGLLVGVGGVCVDCFRGREFGEVLGIALRCFGNFAAV